MGRFWLIFDGIKRLVIFVLGVLVTLDGIHDKSNTVAKLLVGTALLGILPIGDLLPWRSEGRRSKRL